MSAWDPPSLFPSIFPKALEGASLATPAGSWPAFACLALRFLARFHGAACCLLQYPGALLCPTPFCTTKPRSRAGTLCFTKPWAVTIFCLDSGSQSDLISGTLWPVPSPLNSRLATVFPDPSLRHHVGNEKERVPAWHT